MALQISIIFGFSAFIIFSFSAFIIFGFSTFIIFVFSANSSSATPLTTMAWAKTSSGEFQWATRAILQVDEHSWIFGNSMLRRSDGHDSSATWYDDSDDSSYTIGAPPVPLPTKFQPLSDRYLRPITFHFHQGVFAIGERAICKITLPKLREIYGCSTESAALEFVNQKKPTRFVVPKLFHSDFYDDSYDEFNYAFMERLPGSTLFETWPLLTFEWRERYLKAIVDALEEMTSWTSDRVTGPDGLPVSDCHLAKRNKGRRPRYDYTPVAEHCAEMGMDCSKTHFMHLELSPGNIIVEDFPPTTGTIGIIDWQPAGFLPLDWLVTGLMIPRCIGMDSHYEHGLVRILLERGFPEKHWPYRVFKRRQETE